MCKKVRHATGSGQQPDNCIGVRLLDSAQGTCSYYCDASRPWHAHVRVHCVSMRAGVQPDWVLPVALDVGTDNVKLREDPLYCGARTPRERGAAYYALVDETAQAIQVRRPSEGSRPCACAGMHVPLEDTRVLGKHALFRSPGHGHSEVLRSPRLYKRSHTHSCARCNLGDRTRCFACRSGTAAQPSSIGRTWAFHMPSHCYSACRAT